MEPEKMELTDVVKELQNVQEQIKELQKEQQDVRALKSQLHAILQHLQSALEQEVCTEQKNGSSIQENMEIIYLRNKVCQLSKENKELNKETMMLKVILEACSKKGEMESSVLEQKNALLTSELLMHERQLKDVEKLLDSSRKLNTVLLAENQKLKSSISSKGAQQLHFSDKTKNQKTEFLPDRQEVYLPNVKCVSHGEDDASKNGQINGKELQNDVDVEQVLGIAVISTNIKKVIVEDVTEEFESVSELDPVLTKEGSVENCSQISQDLESEIKTDTAAVCEVDEKTEPESAADYCVMKTEPETAAIYGVDEKTEPDTAAVYGVGGKIEPEKPENSKNYDHHYLESLAWIPPTLPGLKYLIMRACQTGRWESCISFLENLENLDGGIKLSKQLNSSKHEQNFLIHIIYAGHTELVNLLLVNGMSPNQTVGRLGNVLLHWAVKGCHPDLVYLLLLKGASTEKKDNYRRTPLSYAAELGHEDIVKMLMEKGADVNTRDENARTPLHHATINNCEEVCEALLSNCKCEEKIVDIFGKSAFDYIYQRSALMKIFNKYL